MADPQKPRLAAILLAAGGSSRLGQPKQLVRLDGVTLVRRAAGLLLDLNIDPVVVVTGHRAEEIVSELHGLDLSLVHNADWEKGMGYSIACGVRKLPGWVDGVLLMLCDQWMLKNADIKSLVMAWNTDISQIILSEWRDKNRYISGPPVIFPCKLIPELKFVKGEAGAKSIIDQNRSIVSRVALQNAKFDLDRPQDLARLKNA
jgi:molybdenum cofactor cytidylyltransferase